MIKKAIAPAIAAALAIACIVVFFVTGYTFNQNQLDTLLILGIVCGGSILYCFIVGEISGNNSQMDKLWSILPAVYAWIIAAKGNLQPRLVIMALLVTLWGIRLTFNFARKGAYKLKFWEGEEDYRWAILRKNKYLSSRIAWMLFDLFFISIYQNVLILLTPFPGLVAMAYEVLTGLTLSLVDSSFSSYSLKPSLTNNNGNSNPSNTPCYKKVET